MGGWRGARWVVGVAWIMAVLSWPEEASACGACFSPPSEDVTSVGAHRMAISVRGNETILWDQIVYTGAPEDFVWVLPVTPGVEVEVADNGFFEALVEQARLQLDSDPFCAASGSDSALVVAPTFYETGPIARSTTIAPDDARSVRVSSEGVVGPYETAILSGDVDVLINWLLDKGYVVPEAFVPLLDLYASSGMSFAVLRLSPGEGVDRMRPVRVRYPGVGPSLPLRLVAAGVVTTVDLELFVIGEGRYEIAGFGNAEVDRDRLAYDASVLRFNYRELFDQALFSGSGVGTNWVTEHAAPLDVAAVRGYVGEGPGGEPRSAAADLEHAIGGMDSPYLTRIRTRLPPSELDTDLTVRLSMGGDLVGPVAVTRVLNAPTSCTADGGIPGDAGDAGPSDAGPRTAGPEPRVCICSIHAARGPDGVTLTLGALLGVALLIRRRR